MGIEHFRDVMKCDLCSYTATGNKVGRHVAINHATHIKERLYALVESVGSLGIIQKSLIESTGWKPTRVRRALVHLMREGRVFKSGLAEHTYFSRDAWIALGRPTEAEVVEVNVTEVETPGLPPEEPMLGSSISTDVNSYILSEEAWHVAAESLIDAHKDEFVRMFQKAYMDVLAKNSTDDVVLARVAAMASTYYDV